MNFKKLTRAQVAALLKSDLVMAAIENSAGITAFLSQPHLHVLQPQIHEAAKSLAILEHNGKIKWGEGDEKDWETVCAEISDLIETGTGQKDLSPKAIFKIVYGKEKMCKR
jgi:hypothetical protein